MDCRQMIVLLLKYCRQIVVVRALYRCEIFVDKSVIKMFIGTEVHKSFVSSLRMNSGTLLQSRTARHRHFLLMELLYCALLGDN